IVTNAHPNDAVESAIYLEAAIPDFEVSLLQVLKRQLWPVVGVSRQVDLSVLTDDCAVCRHEYGRIEPALPPVLERQFCIAKMKSDAESAGFIKQRLNRGIRHRSLEIRIDFPNVFHVIARKERCEGKFRKHHKLASGRRRFTQQIDETFHNRFALVCTMNG